VLEIQNITKSFQTTEKKELLVLKNLSLQVQEGEFVCLLGPSGSGKTTLLNIISGLEKDYSGVVNYSDHQSVKSLSNILVGAVFQEPRLLPWKSVYDNIKLVLLDREEDKNKTDGKIQEFLESVDLWEFRDYYPGQLSGGMQQRVALVRAFIINPELLLMDEPFSSLDDQLKYKLSEELIKLWKISKKTILFVTHNVIEALSLGDRVLFLSGNEGKFTREWKMELPRPRSIRDKNFYQTYLNVLDELEEELKDFKNIEPGTLI